MFRPRVIPVLLLKGQGLVKSKQFTNYRYIGDPINAVRLFNDLHADESLSQIREILHAGAEKVVLNTRAIQHPGFVRQAADTFGSSTITVCIDVKKKFMGPEQVWTMAASKASGKSPVSVAVEMEKQGAGELIIQSIEKDGMMQGYDVPLIRKISEAVTIPVVALGGAGTENDFLKAIDEGFASAVAAGSMFVYHGPRNAVLVNYLTQQQLAGLFRS